MSGPARSERGPRRAAPATFFRPPRWDGPMPPEERAHKVIALGNGLYRLITTTVSEREVTGEQLLELGLKVPEPDVPWTEPTPVHAADRAAALQHWTEHLGGYDPRLSGRIVGFIRELGLKKVIEAIDQVAAMNVKGGAGVKYAEFVRVLRQVRERRGGGT